MLREDDTDDGGNWHPSTAGGTDDFPEGLFHRRRRVRKIVGGARHQEDCGGGFASGRYHKQGKSAGAAWSWVFGIILSLLRNTDDSPDLSSPMENVLRKIVGATCGYHGGVRSFSVLLQ